VRVLVAVGIRRNRSCLRDLGVSRRDKLVTVTNQVVTR
jgi:hypothetical protein